MTVVCERMRTEMRERGETYRERYETRECQEDQRGTSIKQQWHKRTETWTLTEDKKTDRTSGKILRLAWEHHRGNNSEMKRFKHGHNEKGILREIKANQVWYEWERLDFVESKELRLFVRKGKGQVSEIKIEWKTKMSMWGVEPINDGTVHIMKYYC